MSTATDTIQCTAFCVQMWTVQERHYNTVEKSYVKITAVAPFILLSRSKNTLHLPKKATQLK